MEDILIKRIENGIRSIKLGNKSPKEANLSRDFAFLKNINLGLHQDLLNNYASVVKSFNIKKN